MKKSMIAALVAAAAFGFSSTSFADEDPWGGFWGGVNPSADAAFSWVSGGISAGASVAGIPGGGFTDGDIEGGYFVMAQTESSRDDTEAWQAGEIESYSGIDAGDNGDGGAVEAAIGGYSGAWYDAVADAPTAFAVNYNQAILTAEGDSAVQASASGGAYADFFGETGLHNVIEVGGPMPPF